MRTLRDAVSGGKRAAEQGLKLMERFGPPDEKEDEPAWDLEQLTSDELTELQRLHCKATGRMELFYELQEQHKRDREAFRQERIRLFGPSVVLDDEEEA